MLIGLGVWFVTQVLGEGTPDQTQTPTAEAANSTLGSAGSENPAQSTSPAIPTTSQDDDPPQTPSLSVAPVTATCDNTTNPFVCITSLGIDSNGFLVATFDASGFLPLVGPAPNQHVHFYFPVGSMADDQLNAGSSGPDLGEWILWDEAVFAPGPGGVSYSLEDALSVGATELCALVASSSHEVTPGSGSCIPLPESAVN